jgi:hypothetical protein
LTGADPVDGIIGMVFGFYISSHPAAFIVDLLFFSAVPPTIFPRVVPLFCGLPSTCWYFCLGGLPFLLEQQD